MYCKLLSEIYKKSCNEKCDNKLICPIAEQIQISNCVTIIELYYKNCKNKENKENNVNMLHFL